MIYRGAGFFAVVGFLLHPLPLSPNYAEGMIKRDNLLTGEGERVGEEPNYTAARKPGPP
jgi:hypothetical protein